MQVKDDLDTEHDWVDVLVVGEAMIDIIGSKGELREHVGGSPANVALALGRLDVKTTLLTSIGRDSRGLRIAERLRSAGVSVRPESWRAEQTSTAHAQLRADGSASYEFNINWSLPDNVAVPATRVVHVGSIGAFLQPGATQVIELLRALPDSATVSFDPNIRAQVLGKREDVMETFRNIVAVADIVKLSDEDAEFLFPGVRSEDILCQLAAAGVGFAAITFGTDGAVLSNAMATVRVPSSPVSAVDTVGAGDTFMASLIQDSLADHLGSASARELEIVGLNATIASAITVSRKGAEPPTTLEVQAMLMRRD